MKKVIFICFILFTTPMFVHGAITINEVAWMGNAVSANDEWVELYNNGNQSVNVDGWIVSDGVNLNIELTGSIAAGQYAVLERTDDASAPGTAFLIYTGALSNSGVTLSLYRTDGTLEDRVVGGDGWENIGGDNTSKHTAQYTQRGWITAEATPGFLNSESTDPKEDSDNEESNNDTKGGGTSTQEYSSKVSTLYTTQRVLTLKLHLPKHVYVNQEVSMSVDASGVSSPIIHSLIHDWNFGDFSIGTGSDTTHRYMYPGEYVVTLHSKYKKYEAYARQKVVVLPVSFSITISPQGDVQIHNNARYEVDISGYAIHAGKTLRFPERTILLPKATITIPSKKLNYIPGGVVILTDEAKTQIASLNNSVIEHESTVTLQPVVFKSRVTPNSEKIVDTQSEVVSSSSFTFLGDRHAFENPMTEKIVDLKEEKNLLDETLLLAAPIQAVDTIPSDRFPYFALLGVIGIGVLSVFISRVKK